MRASLASPNSSRAREQGAILIMVLLIVALVSALSIKFASQYQLGLARAESRWHGAQARAFLLGTEEVTKLLFPTADFDPKTDYLGEPWSNEVPIEDEGVTGSAKLVDATAKLNLNDITRALADASKPLNTPDRYSEQQRRFIRLLQTFPEFPLRSDEAAALLEAVIDWADDNDVESGQGGAESNYYMGLPEPYMAANDKFKSLDELRLIRGFNEMPLLVAQLLPYLTVLPFADVGLNINTLTLESPNWASQPDDGRYRDPALNINHLWLCINGVSELEPLNPMDAQRLIAERPETGFSDTGAITDTWNRLFAGRPIDITGLNVKTDFFWLESSVQLVDQRRSMRSLLWRGAAQGDVFSTGLKVIQRDDMFELPTVVQPKKDKKRK